MMFKKIICLMGFVFPILLNAQDSLNFDLIGKNVSDLKKVYLLHYSFDDNELIVDSAIVENNEFRIKKEFQGPAYAGIYLKDDMNEPKINKGEFWFFLNPGLNVIDFKGEPKVTDGSPETKAFIAMREKVEKQKEIFSSPAYWNKRKQIDSLQNKIQKLEQEIKESFGDINLINENSKVEFIETHPNNGLSLLLLESIVQMNPGFPKAKELYESLPQKFKESTRGNYIENIIGGSQFVEGELAAEIIQPNQEGENVKLSDFRGKYVLLDFWASWCVPCREENPFVVKAYEKYKSKNFEIFAISLDTEKGNWLEAIKKDNLTWVHGSDLKGQNNSAAEVYGVQGIPANYLIDPDGFIIAKDLRGVDLEKELEKIFR
ncbi:AhpC/TSA family protein [Sphingobacterium daejeonense]|uniref:TlpA disulfide reductase family protein n=1 Tax=Sphingobacterium daejeonense TaxID=371142 RepID=UPI0021A278C1|nr:TlpA disulfide reductase family protein [Sphingobacterium daejeonense]MCT1530947.1 AhpC/TSA family protein [Sphingobacterium daejeonense]